MALNPVVGGHELRLPNSCSGAAGELPGALTPDSDGRPVLINRAVTSNRHCGCWHWRHRCHPQHHTRRPVRSVASGRLCLMPSFRQAVELERPQRRCHCILTGCYASRHGAPPQAEHARPGGREQDFARTSGRASSNARPRSGAPNPELCPPLNRAEDQNAAPTHEPQAGPASPASPQATGRTTQIVINSAPCELRPNAPRSKYWREEAKLRSCTLSNGFLPAFITAAPPGPRSRSTVVSYFHHARGIQHC